MSAYILDPAAFAAIAERATQYHARNCIIGPYRKTGHRMDDALHIAAELARANIASVAARYPDDQDGERPGALGTDAEIVVEAVRIADAMLVRPPELSPVQMLKLLDCFDYQACEVDDYERSDARRQVQAVRRNVIASMPGYDAAAWGIPDGLAERYEPARHAKAITTGADGPICLSALMRR